MEATGPIAAGPLNLPLLTVTGSQPKVGTTTVALNLAAVMADRGWNVLLIDAADHRGEEMWRAEARDKIRFGLADLLAGSCHLSDALVAGPAGISMLLNRESSHRTKQTGTATRSMRNAGDSRHARQRLTAELESAEAEFDLMIVDAGFGTSELAPLFWSESREIVLVTTPADNAVLDAYTTLKRILSVAAEARPRLLVNQARSRAVADGVQRNMDSSSRRFLHRALPALPALPNHVVLDHTNSETCHEPRVWRHANTPFGHAVLWLGRAVSELLERNPVQRELELRCVGDAR